MVLLNMSTRLAVRNLDIGEEDIKGNDVVKRAAELLKDSGLNFVGNVEGDGVFRGEAEVIVCDGFVGNVALKVSEGLAQMLWYFLAPEVQPQRIHENCRADSPSSAKTFQRRVDHRRYNGASLLGLKGIVLKAMDRRMCFHSATLERAADTVRSGVLVRISERVALQQPIRECITCLPVSQELAVTCLDRP